MSNIILTLLISYILLFIYSLYRRDNTYSTILW